MAEISRRELFRQIIAGKETTPIPSETPTPPLFAPKYFVGEKSIAAVLGIGIFGLFVRGVRARSRTLREARRTREAENTPPIPRLQQEIEQILAEDENRNNAPTYREQINEVLKKVDF